MSDDLNWFAASQPIDDGSERRVAVGISARKKETKVLVWQLAATPFECGGFHFEFVDFAANHLSDSDDAATRSAFVAAATHFVIVGFVVNGAVAVGGELGRQCQLMIPRSLQSKIKQTMSTVRYWVPHSYSFELRK